MKICVCILLFESLHLSSARQCNTFTISGNTVSPNGTCTGEGKVCFVAETVADDTVNQVLTGGCAFPSVCNDCNVFFTEFNYTRCCVTCCDSDHCNVADVTNCPATNKTTTTSTTTTTTTTTTTASPPPQTTTTTTTGLGTPILSQTSKSLLLLSLIATLYVDIG